MMLDLNGAYSQVLSNKRQGILFECLWLCFVCVRVGSVGGEEEEEGGKGV